MAGWLRQAADRALHQLRLIAIMANGVWMLIGALALTATSLLAESLSAISYQLSAISYQLSAISIHIANPQWIQQSAIRNPQS